MEQDLPAVFQAMIGKQHQAVTVGKMVRIGKYIVDSCVIDATPAAAALYGVEEPNDLIGCWQSLLQHPDDVRLGRLLAQARRRGIQVPEVYISRIRQLRTPQQYVTVTKDVSQLTIHNDIYWFTVLSEADGPPLMEQDDFWAHFKVPDDVYSYLANCVSIAETEHAIEAHGRMIPEALDSSDPNSFRKVDIMLGESVYLPDASYIHRCARCTAVWKTTKPNPPRCAKRLCHSPQWRTLPKELRDRDVREITSDMVLATRKHRVSKAS